jgi:hypothetical protein
MPFGGHISNVGGSMTNITASTPAASLRCASCQGEIAPADNFCRQCGMPSKIGGSPIINIHQRLLSIESILLKTAIGVGVLLLLVGWLLLQAYHFGKGGILG